jgi:hypothetical protein
MGTPIHKRSVQELWVDTLGFPLFCALMLAATFVGQSSDPAWRMWLVRGGIALFFWLIGWLSAATSFSELQRRGCWLPFGASQRPWLAAALFVAVVLVLAAFLWWALVSGLAWILDHSGILGPTFPDTPSDASP